MMDYETFRKMVEDTFLSYMSDEKQDRTVKIIPVKKVNQTLDGIVVSGKDITISPTVYVNRMYEEYTGGKSIENVISDAADRMKNGLKNLPEMEINIYDAKQTGNIIFQLINARQNESLLEKVPYREFNDLAVIYRMVFGIGEEYLSSAIITSEIAEILCTDEAELYRLAEVNTKRISGISIKTMMETVREFLDDGGMSDMMMEDILQEQNEDVWVITNTSKNFGAATMLYEEELHELAEKAKNDLYILPSSIHEVIAVSAGGVLNPEELSGMLQSINTSEVSPEERLSNQVYIYSRENRNIKPVIDTQMKLIDGNYLTVNNIQRKR